MGLKSGYTAQAGRCALVHAQRDGIDVWLGSMPDRDVTGIACTADAHKRDAEIKLLLGCTAEEMAAVGRFLNSHGLGCSVLSRPARSP